MKRPPYILLILMAVLFLSGCGKDRGTCSGSAVCNSNGGAGTGGTGTPGDDRGTEGGVLQSLDGGATTDLTIVSVERMSEFVLRPLNNPTQVQVNLNLEDWGNGRFGGTVRIAYKDDGRSVVDEFSAGKDQYDVQYNQWFTKSGKDVFHAFFEDEYGAVIVVVDNVTDLGDGTQSSLVSGSVWFRNHLESNAPNPSFECLPGYGCPDTRCWFIEIGPYECRSFLVNDQIKTTAMVEPNNGYVKLGDFNSLNRIKGFNESE